jgi:putative cell wall-binding protein
MLMGMLPVKQVLAVEFDQAAYYLEIGKKLDYWANKYNIPPVLLKAIAWMESGWYQNAKNPLDKSPLPDQPLMGYDGIGIGIMQISSYDPEDTVEVDKLKNDIDYNIEVGCQLLNQKWRAYPKIGNGDRNILENWYFAVWGYNSWQGRNNPNDPLCQGKAYQDTVFALLGLKYNSAVTFTPGATPLPKNSLPASGVPELTSLWSTPSPTHRGDLRYDTENLVSDGGKNYGGQFSDASGDYWFSYSRWASYYALGFYITAYNNPALTSDDQTMLEDKILKAQQNLLAEADNLTAKTNPSAYDLATAAKYYWTILESPNLNAAVISRAQAGLTKAQAMLPEPIPSEPMPIPGEATLERLAGVRAVDTAIELSKAGWISADTVVLATTANYPDALAGAPLAKKYNAPLLLNPPGELDAAVIKELRRLGAQKAFILGGTAVISESIFEALADLKLNPERIAGTTAAETAAEIAKKLGAKQTVMLASTLNFPDALAASAPAAALEIPILLTGRDVLPAATLEVLKDFQVTKTIIVGGSAVIAPAFDDAQKGPLAPYGPLRLSGLTKYDTALKIVNYFAQDPGQVYIATGVNFPDGLAGGALAAKTASPLILIDTFEITPGVLNWLKSIKGKKPQIYILGGTGAISEANKLLIEKTILSQDDNKSAH